MSNIILSGRNTEGFDSNMSMITFIMRLVTKIRSDRNPEALTTDVLIILVNGELVTQIRTAVRMKQQTIEQR